MTYSYLTTQNLYILHPYRRKSIRKDMSDLRLRIECYVSVVSEKDDLPFQLTYHAFFLTFYFQTKNAERHALTQHVKSTTSSGTRTTSGTFYDFLIRKKYVSNILISVLPTYQLSCQEILIIYKAIKEYRGTQRIPFIGKKSRW